VLAVPVPTVPDYLTTDQLSALIGISPITLAQWRRRTLGPAFVRIGRTIRYARADVDAWLAASKVGGKVTP